ncbi:hypothetical protein LAJ19_02380 [Deinococcus taeanensis]|uniref:hypothetical protein n=1 Tax=Deinococcus taeanensis TaxID=2737050 RepID=UPI001CDD4CC5|nr:hypothetical protein [Deinococcus taeanensis]UBV43090.1 hypothetical protein LAJ19_02380 [Deinococcus taeanensis]
MTVPSAPAPRGPIPRRLAFLTVPLMINLIYSAVTLLTLPFSGPVLNDLMAQMQTQMGVTGMTLSPAQVTAVLWLSFALTVVQILCLYYTRRAVLDGRSWGRVSSIVLAVFSLLFFPLGTVLGIVMLIGAFDRDVVAYTAR